MDKGYLETLHRNWPHILEKSELKGAIATPAGRQITAESRLNLRHAGLMVPIEINGKMFMGPGFGMATDRSSVIAVERAGHVMREFARGEATFRAHHPSGNAILFVGKDAAVGYFIPEENKALCVFPSRNAENSVTTLFKRLLEESGIGKRIPDDAIWTASA